MRGKVHKIQAYDLYNRITPAYAGKREPVFFGDGVFQDHPRLCGEKMRRFWRRCILQGSPPPMRGKVETWITIIAISRITPAYAGKRSTCVHGIMADADHPRLCGEKKVYPKDSEIILGSPPPMRGKAFVYFTKNVVCRITPAYAGKSFFHEFYNFFNEDHPRLCGEKLNLFRPCYCSMGSPPPMRGKVPAGVG